MILLGSIFSSSRSALSAEQTIDLVNAYLKTARETPDVHIASILCDDAEISLSQAKKTFKRALAPETLADQTLRSKIGMAYFERGELLKKLGNHEKAEASYIKAQKWGYMQESDKPTPSMRPSSTFSSIHSALLPRTALLVTPQHASSASSQGSLGHNIAQIPAHLFAKNVSAPVTRYDLPQADDPLTSTPQLVYCLGLLPGASLADKVLNSAESTWSQAIAINEIEQKRLRTLATDVIREFTTDELQEATAVTEVVCLAPVLEQAHFKELIVQFVDGIDKKLLLNLTLLEGLAQLIQHTTSGYLTEDDLVKILGLLDTRLEDTHGESTDSIYQLTHAVSHVLDAMADSHVTGIKRETLHEPLSAYLKGLKSSADPYLVYQAAYASQALLYVPNDETLFDAVLRIGGKVFQGAAGVVSAVKSFDLNGFVEGLKSIQDGLGGIVTAAQTLKEGYDTVVSLQESGQSFLDSLQEGYSFNRKSAWYPALQIADQLLQKGQLADFKELVCAAPCRRDPAFQWGVCERLGQLAADPLWEADSRQSALDFLSELYQEDGTWGYHANVKQWIIKILMHLADEPERATATDMPASEKPFEIAPAAKTLLKALAKNGGAQKQALYEACINEDKGRCPYTHTGAPLLASPSLLDRVQNKPEVETDLRKLKHRRLAERGNAVYIAPQGKPNLQAPDEALFDLTKEVKDFLERKQKVLLLLGDSGAGKSTFNRRLEANLWETYQPGGPIPLFINLPTIDKPEHDLVAKHLRKEGLTEPQIKELKDYRQFVLICDGYDESQQTHNLYMSNQLHQAGQWDVQMVISCRSEYLGSDYRDRFQPTDRNQRADSTLFEEAVIAPFSAQKIANYIDQYIQIKQPIWPEKVYQQALDRIPHLKELVRNPFLLTLALEVLPRLVDPTQNFSTTQITRVALYDQFVAQWFERSKKRLEEKVLSNQKKEAFENLADEGFTQNGIAFTKRLAAAIYEQQAGNPIVTYSHFSDKGSWKEEFFGREDEKQLLREASPLTRQGNQYQFIHKSILEYSASRAIFEPRNAEEVKELAEIRTRRGSASSFLSYESQSALGEIALAIHQPLLDSLLARKNLVHESSILQFLAERTQQEPLFKQQLLAVIECSKTDKWVRKAAANAITVLVRARVQFNGADLKGIQIPGANLSEGTFYSAQLQGADLRGVNFRKSWLREANLSGAQMADVEFGERPFLQAKNLVLSCAYSPDGETCAVSFRNNTISVYDSSNWEKIWTLNGHTDFVRSVTYSPQGDQLASASVDKTIRLWDLKTGAPFLTLSGHTETVTSVAYSPQGDQLASASDDKTIRLWNLKTRVPLLTLSGHTNFVTSVAYSPQGDQLASASFDQTVRLWDTKTGAYLHTLSDHTAPVIRIAYSPQGDQLASVSFDQTVRLWDTKTGACLHTLSGHAGFVFSVAYSPKGDQLASGGEDTTVRVWETKKGTPLFTLNGHKGNVVSIVYSPQGDQLASGGDTTVRLWEVKTDAPLLKLNGHTERVNRVAHSPQGKQLASASFDGTVRLWDTKTGISLFTLSDHTEAVTSVAYSPQEDQLASASYDKTVRLWDTKTGACLHTLSGHTDWTLNAVYSSQGDQLASASHDKTIRLWDTKTGACLHTLSGHTSRITMINYSPQGDQLVSTSYDKTVRLWDTKTGACLHTLSGHTDWTFSAAYSPEGDQLASASHDKTVRLWDTKTGACLLTLKDHTDKAQSVRYSPQGDQLASGSMDKTVRLWDAKTGSCLHTLSGHTGWIINSLYSPQGDQLVSFSKDNTVRLWDTKTGKCQMVIDDCGPIRTLAWEKVSDSHYFWIGSTDNSVGQWEVKKEGEEYKAFLRWSSGHSYLTVKGASIEGAQGLSQVNKAFLKQRGAVGKPSLSLRETTQKVIGMSSVLSKLRLPSNHETLEPAAETQANPAVRQSARSNASASERGLFSHFA